MSKNKFVFVEVNAFARHGGIAEYCDWYDPRATGFSVVYLDDEKSFDTKDEAKDYAWSLADRHGVNVRIY